MAIKSSKQKRLRRHERTRYLWCTLILVLGLPAWLAVAENASESVRVAQRQSLKDLLKSVQSYRQQSDAATEELLNQQKKKSPAVQPNVDVTPPPSRSPRHRISVQQKPLADVTVNPGDGRISLTARNAPLGQIIAQLADSHSLNVVTASDTTVPVTIKLSKVRIQDALDAVLSVAGYTWHARNGIIYISSISGAGGVNPNVQGRVIKVFRLDYADAEVVVESVNGLLSLAGKAFAMKSDPDSSQKTMDSIVVEDVPYSLKRIARYMKEVDVRPRQVMIQAHILQITLDKNDRHGVNYQHVFDMAGRTVDLNIKGFADPSASTAFLASVTSTDVNALLEILRTTTDAKTLASPKVVALNGQKSRIQIGEQLGFRVTTTTETSTQESVEFLEVGVVLEVTARITRNNSVIMTVKPEVSSGQINPDTGLPEEETTEVESSVMMENGKGLVIGGLIQETDSTIQSKLPFLGDLYLIGKLFQKNRVVKSRKEILITLVPHIMPYEEPLQDRNDHDFNRSSAELFHGPLKRIPRPWAPQLQDSVRNPGPWIERLPPVDRHRHDRWPDYAQCDCEEHGPHQFHAPQPVPNHQTLPAKQQRVHRGDTNRRRPQARTAAVMNAAPRQLLPVVATPKREVQPPRRVDLPRNKKKANTNPPVVKQAKVIRTQYQKPAESAEPQRVKVTARRTRRTISRIRGGLSLVLPRSEKTQPRIRYSKPLYSKPVVRAAVAPRRPMPKAKPSFKPKAKLKAELKPSFKPKTKPQLKPKANFKPKPKAKKRPVRNELRPRPLRVTKQSIGSAAKESHKLPTTAKKEKQTSSTTFAPIVVPVHNSLRSRDSK